MAEEMLLCGQNVVPGVLTGNAFEYRHPTIDSALAFAKGTGAADDRTTQTGHPGRSR
jgi:hypothetical protein